MEISTNTGKRVLSFFLIAYSCAISYGNIGTAQSMNEARSLYRELATTQSLISEEENEWAREKSSIQDLLEITRQESALLNDKIKALNENVTTTDEDREKLLTRISEARAASESFTGIIAGLEESARGLLPMIPEILKSELQPLIMRLPKDSSKTNQSISQRMQTVIALLTQMGKFNTSLTLNSEVKDLGEGNSVEVKTLYLGLGMAIFTDPSGKYSGYGKPSPEGWSWNTVEGPAADRIIQALAVYESTTDPTFVSLPVDID